jgi:hypothetical protein
MENIQRYVTATASAVEEQGMVANDTSQSMQTAADKAASLG